jgi:hypothetical protein
VDSARSMNRVKTYVFRIMGLRDVGDEKALNLFPVLFFIESPFYFQSVYVHSANWCVRLGAMAWGGALSSALP